jgi:hypothetical protein
MHARHLALTTLALALGLGSMQAAANEHAGWVYNGLLGQASLHADALDDSRFASSSSIGYRWGVVGVEAGHTMSFGRFSDSFGSGTSAFDVDAKVSGWNLGLNANHDLSERWSLQARAGVFAWDAKLRLTDATGARLEESDSGNDWYAGASVDYAWKARSSIGLGYMRFKAGDAHVDLWGLHSEYRF